MNSMLRPRYAIILCALLAAPAWAGSIFDDDWTPPPPRKPIITTPPTEVTPPPQTPNPQTPTTPESSTPKPDKKPAKTKTPDSTTPVEVKPAVPTRRPIPEKTAQAKSRKLFKEVFAKELTDRSATGRRALAATLIAQAGKTADEPSDQFVLLVGAADAAREANDLELCIQASDRLADAYQVDALPMKTDAALKMTLRADTPAVNAENVRAGMELVNQLVAAEDYSSASRLLAKLSAPAASDPKLAAQVQARTREVEAIRIAADRLPPAIAKLKTSPDDPAANLTFGRFLCLMKGDWERGLPMLAKSTDPLLKPAAVLDVADPKDAEKQIAAGDAWWTAADKDPTPSTQSVLRQRAVHWYTVALDSGKVTGLGRTRLEQRLAQANPKPAEVASAKTDSPAASAAHTAGAKAVIHFGTGSTVEKLLNEVGGGSTKNISQTQAAASLADPATFASASIVCIGPGQWKTLSSSDITDTVKKNLYTFVGNGGDLIMFEQYQQGNMDAFESIFGIKTKSSYFGANISYAPLSARAKAKGVTQENLDDLYCYNSYENLPRNSIVLLKSGSTNAAVIAPFGKGRLILIGFSVSSSAEKLDEAIFEMIYGTPKK